MARLLLTAGLGVLLILAAPIAAFADTAYSNLFTIDLRGGGAPNAAFTWSPSTPVVNAPVQFTDTSTGSPTSWSWAFGDGGTSSQRNPSHTYTTTGNKTVTLTVSSGAGSDSVSHTVTVVAGGGTCDFTVSDVSPEIGQTVTFTAPVEVNPVQWDFGGEGCDGADRVVECLWGPALCRSMTYAYAGSGSKRVTLTCDGGSRTRTVTVSSTGSCDGGCSWAVSPTAVGVGAAGGTGTVTVDTGVGCAWSASSGAGWIQVTSGGSGSGPGTVGYRVDRNPGSQARQGVLTVAGTAVTITQEGQSEPCTYTVEPSAVDVAADGASGTLTVDTRAGCEWTAQANAAWIRITSGGSGSGPGSVGYRVERNPEQGARLGSMTVAGVAVGVRQDGEGDPETDVSPPGVPVSTRHTSATGRGGRRVVVWQQLGSGPKAGLVPQGEDGIFGRLYGPDGEPEGGTITVASGPEATLPTVGFDGEGGFVIGWQAGDDGIVGRWFDPEGEPTTGVFTIDEGVAAVPDSPSVATAAAGDSVMVWRAGAAKAPQGEDGIYARFFDPEGEPEGETVRVDEGVARRVGEPSVAAGASGNAVVVWAQEASSKQGDDGIFGRFYGPDGEPEGDPGQLNDQPEGEAAAPDVGADAAGEAVVVWAQDLGSGDGWDIYARLLDDGGEPLGGQFRVNTEVAGDQVGPSVGVNPAGDFTVAWTSGEDGIFGRFYEAGGIPLGPQFAMVESEAGLVPTEPEISVAGDDAVSVTYARIDDDGEASGVYLKTYSVTSPPGTCEPDGTTACLNDNRFRVTVSWRDFTDRTGQGRAVPLTDDTGYYWFFDDGNVELLLKVLDGTGINGHYWVYYGALSNVEYSVVVTDSLSGSSVTYHNPSGTFASVGDAEALPEAKAARPRHVERHVEPAEWAGQVATSWLPTPPQGCTPGATVLCLNRDRFRVQATWRDFAGNTGDGRAVPLTADTGTFWFFDDANLELVLKVLDGRAINDHFWVFYGALSNVAYTITVTDTATGQVRTYTNPAGTFGSVGDTEAFRVP